MKWFNIAFIFLILILSSCRNESTYPKPKSYLRIDLPEKGYYEIEKNTCPFSFEIPNYATWKQRFKNNNSCSKAVLFPQFNAEILCDYVPLENDILRFQRFLEIKCTITVLNQLALLKDLGQIWRIKCMELRMKSKEIQLVILDF